MNGTPNWPLGSTLAILNQLHNIFSQSGDFKIIFTPLPQVAATLTFPLMLRGLQLYLASQPAG